MRVLSHPLCHVRKKSRWIEKIWKLYKKVLFRKTTYRRSTRLIHVGICCWTVISNGSYGHLNNHLAHPPSLNSPHLLSFSLSRSSLLPFSEPRCYQRHTLWRLKKKNDCSRWLSIFLPLRQRGLTIIRHRWESIVLKDQGSQRSS